MNIKVVDIKSRIISSASAVKRKRVDKDKIKVQMRELMTEAQALEIA